MLVAVSMSMRTALSIATRLGINSRDVEVPSVEFTHNSRARQIPRRRGPSHSPTDLNLIRELPNAARSRCIKITQFSESVSGPPNFVLLLWLRMYDLY